MDLGVKRPALGIGQNVTGPQTVAGDTWVWLPFALAGLVLTAAALVVKWLGRGRPSSPTELLLRRGVALAVLAALIATLADAAAEDDGVTFFDRPVWSWFIAHRTAAATAFFKVVTTLGSTVAMGGYAILAVGWLVVKGRRSVVTGRLSDALLVAVVGAGAAVFVTVGKHLVGRTRPPVEFRLVTEANQSFPSGHALASTAVIGALLVIAGPHLARGRLAVVVSGLVAVLLIGLSRLYLGVHWATDVLGGWLTGAAWLLLCVTVRWLVTRRVATSAGHRPSGPWATDPTPKKPG